MGQTREGLGEMADPADLVTALVQVGLLKRAFIPDRSRDRQGRRAGDVPAGDGPSPGRGGRDAE
jgi:hypothetical protein